MDIRTLIDPKTTAYDAYEELSNYGFSDAAKALTNLKLIAEGVKTRILAGILDGLLRACSMSADPDTCLNSFERVSAASESRKSFLGIISSEPDGIKLLAPLFASSKFLTTFMAGSPEELIPWLLEPGRLAGPRERVDLLAEALALCPEEMPPDEAMSALRGFKYREFLRLTVRDLLGRSELAETTQELSDIAEAALEAALRVASRHLDKKYGPPVYTTPDGQTVRCPFTVIAMGKLGGLDLNYSSDIDLMYLYLTDQGTTAGPVRMTSHQYFVKLSELVTKMIGENTADGMVFRVDLRLRPEGERGDIVQGLHGYEIYYESWGKTWERSALIKARPCAGDMDLGRAFLGMIQPFVFRKYLDYGAIGEIREMKERIEKAGALKAAKEIDLKLGVGGIREIEFFISILQLIYGGRDPGIRERNTMKALHRLALKDLITFEEQRDLTRAYEFLRTAEHRLQVVDERQTHSLPDDDREVQALALRMGYRDGVDKTAAEGFRQDYERHTRRVRGIYDGLFADRTKEKSEKEDELDLLLSEDMTEEEAAGILTRLGFVKPHQAYRNVLLMRDGSADSALTPRSRRLFIEIIPALLSGCSSSPDPDMALNNLESFITSFGSREALHAMLTGKPDSAGLITRLFGTTEYFSRLLIGHPEMSDLLLLPGEDALDKPRDEMRRELDETLAGAGGFAEKMDLLRRYKHMEELRIGLKDVFYDPGCRSVSSALTDLAETVLEAVLSMSIADLEVRYGLPKGLGKGGGIAVIGFGKLGGGELDYGSDLDIIFIYEKAGATTGEVKVGGPEFFARLSERVLFALSSLTREGFAFRVDTRLRPGGSKGVLAHTLESIGKYYSKAASTWELQALTRARAVAGDPVLCAGFESLRKDALVRPREQAELASGVKAMRARMERELGKKSKGYHIKYGKGGLVDVEFIVQYLQLLHGREHPELLATGTVTALDVLVSSGIISGSDGDALKDSYGFLRELESKLRITTGQPEGLLPEDMTKLALLAARTGYGSGDDAAKTLIDEYLAHTGKVREIFERVFKA